ncbi:hypothetical protein E2C01_053630 [Portunus trituberculatus]|uniref:Uncharacterized protein n=1 Tax=Portunus trituberculatus TaxID=210409 RepID=A0A5B7GPY6_PORTR|nr:hypothetical protein [Portunus trituberculatus]
MYLTRRPTPFSSSDFFIPLFSLSPLTRRGKITFNEAALVHNFSLKFLARVVMTVLMSRLAHQESLITHTTCTTTHHESRITPPVPPRVTNHASYHLYHHESRITHHTTCTITSHESRITPPVPVSQALFPSVHVTFQGTASFG